MTDHLPETLARADGIAGEVVLRRRPAGPGDRGHASGMVHELIVNGTFLMDTAETTTERLLAEVVLDGSSQVRRVLVGGLGLGFTVAALLDEPHVEQVVVAELEPLLVGWLRDGLVPGVAEVMADPRVTVVVDDIRQVLASADPDGFDAILLDVDNGPDFLVRDENADVYQRPALRAAAAAVRPGGRVVVWSAAPSEPLRRTLADAVGPVDVVERTVTRQGRSIDYHLYVATRVRRSPSVATE